MSVSVGVGDPGPVNDPNKGTAGPWRSYAL